MVSVVPGRKKPYRTIAPAIATGLLFTAAQAAPIRNVILCIGDGMAEEQVKAARFYAGTNLCFESFPYQSFMTTDSADSSVTDSAASGTAIATGVKVNNYVLSLQLPGDGRELETMLEYFSQREKMTGLVTTSYITHATPAAFGAHTASRHNTNEIAADYLTQTRPNILFGGGGYGITPESAETAGYTVVTNRATLLALNPAAETYVSGQFGCGHMPYEYDGLALLPRLHEMVQAALSLLDNDPDGFFLMIEGARIDHAGHNNDIIRSIHETLEFSESVQVVYLWMQTHTNTLLLVTADHECGGLEVLEDNGPGCYPTVAWTTTSHTDEPVPVYAAGLQAHQAANVTDNTDIHTVALCPACIPETCLSLQAAPEALNMVWTASSGDVYRLEYTPDLASSNWYPLTSSTSHTFRLSIADTNLTQTAGFYRLFSE